VQLNNEIEEEIVNLSLEEHKLVTKEEFQQNFDKLLTKQLTF
jgi:hypothetical protein